MPTQAHITIIAQSPAFLCAWAQLRINGKGGGSERMTGTQLMGIWDGLCTQLRAREVSVEDVSAKSGMLLRMLHAAAHEVTWWVWV